MKFEYLYRKTCKLKTKIRINVNLIHFTRCIRDGQTILSDSCKYNKTKPEICILSYHGDTFSTTKTKILKVQNFLFWKI